MRPQGPTFWLLDGRTGWRTAYSDNVSLGARSGMRLMANPEGPLSLKSQAGDLGRLVLPRGMALDDSATLYLLVESRARIKRFDPIKRGFANLPQVGGRGSEARQFESPTNIACAGRNLYVADSGNHRVQVFDLSSLALRYLWGPWDDEVGPVKADDPRAWIPVDVTAAGDSAYILDQRYGRLYRHQPGSDVLHLIVDEPEAANRWTRVALDRDGRIYLLDPQAPRLEIYNPLGRRIFRLTGQSLERLKSAGVPDSALTELEKLEDQDIEGKDRFLAILRKKIEDDYNDSLGERIAEHAVVWDAGDVRDRFDPPRIRLDQEMRFCLPARLMGSLQFRAHDLKNPGRLAAKLSNRQDSLTEYLSACLSSDTRDLLEKYFDYTLPHKDVEELLRELQQELANELNRQLRNRDLYDEQRFAKIELTTETKNLIRQRPKAEALKYLNRLLLEQAFPDEIEKGCLVWYGPQAVAEAPPLEDPLALCPPGLPEGLIFNRTGTRVPRARAEQIEPGTKLYQSSGTWISQALDSGKYQCQWHRLVLDLEALPAGTQVIVSTYTDEADRPVQEIKGPGTLWETRYAITGVIQPPPASDPESKSKPKKPQDLLVQSRQGRYLWLRLELRGDGYTTPSVCAIRAHYPRLSYLEYLPDVFQADDESRWFLERFLSIFQTEWDNLESGIEDIAQYFDPDAVPDDDAMEYLARWLALPLEKEWNLEQKRRLLTLAPRLYTRRGTIEGLQDYIRVYLKNMIGMEADAREAGFKITTQVLDNLKFEGVPEDVLKRLGDLLDQSIMGEGKLMGLLKALIGEAKTAEFGSLILLHASQEQLQYPRIVEGFRERRFLQVAMENQANLGQGAPLWGPAMVGRLQLDEFAREGEARLVSTGDPERDVFHEYANRFRVFLPAAWVHTAEEERRVRRALDAEKPAHTYYDLCLVEPRFRVGFQSTVGLDTIIGAFPVARLACPHETDAPPSRPPRHRLGYDTILAGEPADQTGLQLAPHTLVGLDTILR
jgi:phage tail-like protein